MGDDLGHRLGPPDEDAQHLGGDLQVVERAAIGQAVAEQAIDHVERVPGRIGAAARNGGQEVFEVVGSCLAGIHAFARLGEAAGVDGGEDLRREIGGNAKKFADDGGHHDAAVILGQVERTARKQRVETFVGQRADAALEVRDGPWPERARVGAPDLAVQVGVEHGVKRQRVQRRVRDRAAVVLRENRCRWQRALRGDKRAVVDFQHRPDVLEARQREGVPLRHVVHRVVVAQDSVVGQRVRHHRRVEGIIAEAVGDHRVPLLPHCNGDGGRACRIESSHPSRKAGATLIQVTISAGGLSFHDG